MAGARKDGMGQDGFEKLVYAADTGQGAGSILTSMKEGKPIRVFRSSNAKESLYRALEIVPRKARNRYDGLYGVVSVEYTDDDGKECQEIPSNVSGGVPGRIYKFQLVRDSSLNAKSTEDLVRYSITNKTQSPDARLKLSRLLVSEDQSNDARTERLNKRFKRKLVQQHFMLEKRYNIGS